MTGIEKITGRIEADARAEAAAITAEANAKCAEIRAEYEKKAQDAYWERVRTGVKECEDRVQRMERLAEMESKKSILSLKQTMVEEAFQRAVERIVSMPQEEYVAAMAKLVASAAVSGEEAVLLCERDCDRCGVALVAAANALLAEQGRKAALTLSGETRDMRAGFVLQQGDVAVNCAVEILAAQSRSALASRIASALFD